MVDIATFIQNQGRLEPLDIMQRVEGLQSARNVNALNRQRLEQANELRGALRGGDVNELSRIDPTTATQVFDLQGAQEQQAALRLMTFAGSIENSTRPKAMLNTLRNNPEFMSLLESIGIDPSLIGDPTDLSDDEVRQGAVKMRDSLSNFISGPLGMLGNTALPSDVRSALAFQRGDEDFREAFLASKRARQIEELGGVPTDITGGELQPISTLDAEINAADVLAGAAQRGREQAITAEVPVRGEAQRAVQLQNEAPGTFRSVEFAVSELDRFTEQAQLLRNHPGLKTATGFGGEQLSGIPGTPAADAAALMDTLRSQSFVSALGAMRASSKTGGAVGNVSDAEGGRFENAFISLLQAQSFEQFVEQLDRLIGINADSRKRIIGAYEQEFGDVPNAPKFEAPDKDDKLPDFKNLSEEQLRKLVQ